MSRRQIITEREVQRAKREGKSSIDVSDAVVTPSGRDAAKVTGVELTGAKTAKPSRTSSSPERSAGSPAKRAGRPEPGARAAAGSGRKSPRAEPPDRQTGATPKSEQHQSTAPTTPSVPRSSPLTVAMGADHGGVALKDAIAARLRDLGHTVQDLGTTGTDPVDYPDFAIAVARAVASGAAALGIMVDGAGIGSAMAANKVPGARAALCYDLTTATNAREHNNANVLTLGGGLIGKALALAIVDTFITVPFAGGRHAKRVQKIDALDEARGPR